LQLLAVQFVGFSVDRGFKGQQLDEADQGCGSGSLRGNKVEESWSCNKRRRLHSVIFKCSFVDRAMGRGGQVAATEMKLLR